MVGKQPTHSGPLRSSTGFGLGLGLLSFRHGKLIWRLRDKFHMVCLWDVQKIQKSINLIQFAWKQLQIARTWSHFSFCCQEFAVRSGPQFLDFTATWWVQLFEPQASTGFPPLKVPHITTQLATHWPHAHRAPGCFTGPLATNFFMCSTLSLGMDITSWSDLCFIKLAEFRARRNLEGFPITSRSRSHALGKGQIQSNWPAIDNNLDVSSNPLTYSIDWSASISRIQSVNNIEIYWIILFKIYLFKLFQNVCAVFNDFSRFFSAQFLHWRLGTPTCSVSRLGSPPITLRAQKSTWPFVTSDTKRLISWWQIAGFFLGITVD